MVSPDKYWSIFSDQSGSPGVVKSKDDPNQLGTEITLIARIALHLSYSDLTTPFKASIAAYLANKVIICINL